VVSGTATLETALWKVPQVVVYKTSPLLYWLVKKIIKIPYISLVNIILERAAVPERIQQACCTKQLAEDLPLLLEGAKRAEQLSTYADLAQKLGQPGASHRAAQQILQFIQKQLPPSSPSI
jgi:lipid-A-disaccharide synthase